MNVSLQFIAFRLINCIYINNMNRSWTARLNGYALRSTKPKKSKPKKNLPCFYCPRRFTNEGGRQRHINSADKFAKLSKKGRKRARSTPPTDRNIIHIASPRAKKRKTSNQKSHACSIFVLHGMSTNKQWFMVNLQITKLPYICQLFRTGPTTL